jgi:hypothetical protein
LGGAALDAGFLLELFISTSATTENLNEMIGPFVFDFMVPFHGGKAVEIRQTVEEAGIAIHLEKVLVSPWGTRATFKLPAEYTGRKGGTLLTGSIQTPDGDVKGTFFEGFRDGDFVKYFLGDFTEQNGQWTLTIKEIVLPGSNLEPGPHPASDTVRIQGPWVFNFETG